MVVIIVLATVSMIAADILSTLLVQAEARNRAHLAGLLDAFAWGAGILVTFVSVTALQGHSFWLKVGVVIGVSAANYFGTVAGVLIGKKFVKDATTLSERVARLEGLSPQIDTRVK